MAAQSARLQHNIRTYVVGTWIGFHRLVGLLCSAIFLIIDIVTMRDESFFPFSLRCLGSHAMLGSLQHK